MIGSLYKGKSGRYRAYASYSLWRVAVRLVISLGNNTVYVSVMPCLTTLISRSDREPFFDTYGESTYDKGSKA